MTVFARLVVTNALALVCFIPTDALAQDLRFSIPVEATLGRDVVIVNHVDHDTAVGRIRDHACGIQTYDGHEGTDFVLRSFRQMDTGVYVVAAAPGRVIAVIDSMYDRNKISVKERGFGNYLAIQHDEGYISYYGHIRKNSAIVAVGDVVKRNQRLAFVGSSGNSSDPHVHFEVWRRVDPFAGACSDDLSLWQSQPEYNTAYRLLDHGLTTWPPLLDTLRERPPNATLVTRTDSTITFWSLQQGILATDELTAEWTAPDNSLWFRYSAEAGVASEYYYWWSFIERPSIPGTYVVRFLVNGIERASDSVDVEPITGVRPVENISPSGVVNAPIDIRVRGRTMDISSREPSHVDVYDITGRLLFSHDFAGEGAREGAASVDLPSGTVIVRIRSGNASAAFLRNN